MTSEKAIAGPHLAIYEALYNELNPQQLNVVDATTVAQFLKRSEIGVLQLSQIWEVSDRDKKGYLDKLGIFTAFKLIACLQQGHTMSVDFLVDNRVGAPKFHYTDNVTEAPSVPSATILPVAGAPSNGSVIYAAHQTQRSCFVASRKSLIEEWEIDNQEQNKYETIFYSLNPVNGRLSGEQCRSVLLNSRLPQSQLARIWDLADVDQDGQLDKYEMCIALHLVYCCLNGESLPSRLPDSLIHPMKRVQCSISTSGSITTSPAATRRSSAASILADAQTSFAPVGSIHSLYTSATDVPVSSIFYHTETSGPWPINIAKYQPRFQQLDTDSDGFLSGLDVKSYAIDFDMPQAALAHIWALVDIFKSGRINLEQFSLWSEIMKEVRDGSPLPKYLPEHLIPPSLRPSTASSLTSNSLNNISSATVSAASGDVPSNNNPQIIQLTAEIESAMENRRAAEQDLFQLEADTLVKNSEIKNLELEFQTLSTTVKQLQHQKVEAGKRLADLDVKIGKLEMTCAENGERLASEEERLQRAKFDIAQANDNLTAEKQAMKELRTESNEVGKKLTTSVQAVAEQNGKIERLVDQLTITERHNDEYVAEISRVEKLAVDLAAIVDAFNKSTTIAYENNIDETILGVNFSPADLTILSSTSAVHKVSLGSADLFKDDPFCNTDESDPFGASANKVHIAEFADFSKFSA